MKIVKGFFKQKETYVGIGAALMFQFIFFIVWLTAYDGVLDRADQLKVAVVNGDHHFGTTIVKEVERNLPFHVVEVENIEKAQKDLEKRKYHMVIELPEDLSANIQAAKSSELKFYINQSTATMSKQVMESAADTITSQVNEQVATKLNEEVRTQVVQGMSMQAKDPEAAQAFAQSVIDQTELASELNPIQSVIKKVYEVDGFTATMIPLLVVLASFVGAMLMSQQLELASYGMASEHNLWALFGARQFINFAVAITISIITISLLVLFKIDLKAGVIEAWLFQSLLFFSFLSVSQVFVLLIGNAGMVFNVIFMSTQLVTSGVIVPKEMLSTFYQQVGDFLPATSGANGYFSIVFGGGDLSTDFKHLTLILICSLIGALCSVFIRSKLKFKREGNIS